MNKHFEIKIAGENALIVYFGQQATPEIAGLIQQAQVKIKKVLSLLLIDLVPSYSSIMIVFDLDKTDYHFVRIQLRQLLNSLYVDKKQSVENQGSIIELQAYYGLEVGIDLSRVASNAKLSVTDVIALHQAQIYRVYAIGFAPGFAYLGEVDSRITTPRLDTPRQKVPQGAIAIADKQTAVYPAESPGGWNIIGLCPTAMFEADKEPTMPVKVGDSVKFKAIDKAEFIRLGGVMGIYER